VKGLVQYSEITFKNVIGRSAYIPSVRSIKDDDQRKTKTKKSNHVII